MINDKLKLLCLAVAGTLIGYGFARILIPEISFFKYLAIEAVITILHALYERTKDKTVNT
jgi:hypothetical protein